MISDSAFHSVSRELDEAGYNAVVCGIPPANVADLPEDEQVREANHLLYDLVQAMHGTPVWLRDEDGNIVAAIVPPELVHVIPAWLAYAGTPLDDIPEHLREGVRKHREETRP